MHAHTLGLRKPPGDVWKTGLFFGLLFVASMEVPLTRLHQALGGTGRLCTGDLPEPSKRHLQSGQKPEVYFRRPTAEQEA